MQQERLETNMESDCVCIGFATLPAVNPLQAWNKHLAGTDRHDGQGDSMNELSNTARDDVLQHLEGINLAWLINKHERCAMSCLTSAMARAPASATLCMFDCCAFGGPLFAASCHSMCG